MTLLAVLAFLAGSIPFGLIVGRLFFRSDIRASGSGNIGAANALRTYGKGGGAAVLVLDALKGFVPTLVALHSLGPGTFAPAVVAFCTVAGHCFSPWLRFRGGKGVATWLGALFAFSWLAGLAFVAVWLAVVVPTRYASLGSLVATVASIAVLGYAAPPDSDAWLAGLFVAIVIFWKHRANVARLLRGRENKLALRRVKAADARPEEAASAASAAKKDAASGGLNTGPT